MTEVRSARSIQARQRGIMQRRRIAQQRAAATRIQKTQRGRAARALLRATYATVLQRLCRRHVVRLRLQQQRAAAQLMQRIFRSWRTRRIVAALKTETHWYTVMKKVTAQVSLAVCVCVCVCVCDVLSL